MANVRSAEVRGLLTHAFPHSPSSAVEVTMLMRLAFPACESKRDTKGNKETFYTGFERQMASPSTPTTSLEAQLNFKDAQIEVRVQELEAEVHSQRHGQSLTQQPSSMYKDELLSLVSGSKMISDGPITMEGLQTFSLSNIISEIRQLAPLFSSLLCDLGDVRRNADDADSLTPNEIKALVSLCVLNLGGISQYHAHCTRCE